MGEFFKGWRRKTGIVTLVLALAFMGLWVRSLTVCDVATIGFQTRTFAITSMSHCLYGEAVLTKDGKREKTLFIPRSSLISEGKRSPPSIGDLSDGRWEIALGEFEIKGATGLMGFPSDLVPKPSQPIPFSNVVAKIPYWSIVIPLTLLSAWLLLSQPRELKHPLKAPGKKLA